MVFNRLTVLGLDVERSKKGKRKFWLCKCSCGSDKTISVTTNQLTSEHTQSCGCLKSERISERNKKYCSKTNRIEIIDDDIIIYDDKNNFCTVDKEDYDKIKDHYWKKLSDGYWRTGLSKEESEKLGKSCLKLHQEIAKIKYGEYDTKSIFPDHLDRDKSNNKKNNLVLKSNKDNMKNRSLSKTNTSGKTGVSYSKSKGMYTTYITIDGKREFLGDYDSIEEAVKVRKQAEKKYGFTCDDICCEYDD